LWHPMFKKAKKLHFKIKTKLEAGESGGSNRSRGGGGLTVLF